MGGVEHSDSAGVEVEDDAFFGVDSDAVSGEFSSVVEQSDPVAELDAQLSPAVYYPGTIVVGYLEPLVEAGEQSFGERNAVAGCAGFDVDACCDGFELGGEGRSGLVAVYSDADDVCAAVMLRF